MKPHLLFPSTFRYLGFLLAIPGFILGYITLNQGSLLTNLTLWLHVQGSFIGNTIENFANEVALTMVIVGLLFIAFSKLRQEDELTSRVRMYALYWAILANTVVFAALILFITISIVFHINTGGGFLGPYAYLISFSTYNLFTPLVIFILIFYYHLYRNKNEFVIKPIKYLQNKRCHVISKWLSIVICVILLAGSMFADENPLASLFFLLPFTLTTWAYTKEKYEDEYITQIRMEAMQVAIYVNYSLLLIANFSIYGWSFWTVQDFNFVTIPAIFIIWFRYKRYLINRLNDVSTITS